jgi:hypothetical protein
MARPNVFISYSHEDQRFLRSLLPYLESLEQQNFAEIWSDEELKGGDRWPEEIEAALNSATVAVLLISQKFLTSRFIYKEELPRIFRRQIEGKLTVLPVYLSPSTVRSASISFKDNDGIEREVALSNFQGFGTPDRTIKELAPTERDRRFLQLHDRIKDLAASKDLASSFPPPAVASAVRHVAAIRPAETSPGKERPLDLTGDWIVDDGTSTYDARLKQVGDRVSGEYDLHDGTGTIDGLVEGNLLKLGWDQPFNQRGGEAKLRILSDGQTMMGRWNYDPTKHNSGLKTGGAWNFRKLQR